MLARDCHVEHSSHGEGVKKPTQVNTRSFKGKYCAVRIAGEREGERSSLFFDIQRRPRNSALFQYIFTRVFKTDVTQLLLLLFFRCLFRQNWEADWNQIVLVIKYGATRLAERNFLPEAPANETGERRKRRRRRRKDKSILVLVSRCLIKAESEPTAAPRKVMNNQQVVARGECCSLPQVAVYTYIYSI